MGEHPEIPSRKAWLLKRQKGKCAHCSHHFKDGDLIEVDHIIPRALRGKDEYRNLQLLHRHCHDVKTHIDLINIRKNDTQKLLTKLAQEWDKVEWVWKNDIPMIGRTGKFGSDNRLQHE